MAQEAGEKQILLAERGPFTGGYTSSVPAFMARPDQLIGSTAGTDTNSSRDVNIDPFTGAVSRRVGSAILNDTAGQQPTAGILNAKVGFKCRKLEAISSPSLTSNTSPTIMGLFGEDSNLGFPTFDDGFHGTMWLSSTNTAANDDGKKNYSLLEDFIDGTSYSKAASTDLTKHRMKVVPILSLIHI